MAAELTGALHRISPYLRLRIPVQGTRPAWWKYPFGIDEVASGINIDAFYQELIAEGVRIAREYVPPVFEYSVFKDQRTYGNSRFPFSATRYVPPAMKDFPGLQEFRRNLMYLGWSHSIGRNHIALIARATEKVLRALGTHVRGTRTESVPENHRAVGSA
jgi:hypothetical protein